MNIQEIFFGQNFIHYLNDDEFLKFAFLYKNNLYKKRLLLIQRKKSAKLLVSLLHEFKNFYFNELLQDIKTGVVSIYKKEYLIDFISILFIKTNLNIKKNENIQNLNLHKIVNSITTINEICSNSSNEFYTKKKFIYRKICPVYRMVYLNKKLMINNCPHAKALIY